MDMSLCGHRRRGIDPLQDTQPGILWQVKGWRSLLYLLMIWFVLTGETELVDRIVARVNDGVITLSELKEAAAPYTASLSDKEEIRKVEQQVLNTLIEERLIIDKAKNLNITVSEEEIDEAIEEVKQRHSLDDYQFQQLLERQATTWEEYREEIRDQILLTKALNLEVNSKIELKESDAKKYYEEHLSEFLYPKDVRLRQIFILCPEGADPAEQQRAQAEAEHIYRELMKGEDFGKLAKKYSQDPSSEKGGDIGYVKEGELLAPLEEVVFQLKEGEISRPIKTKRGYHIFKVEEVRDNRVRPFQEVKDTILNKLYKERFAQRQKQWMEEIREESFVEILY